MGKDETFSRGRIYLETVRLATGAERSAYYLILASEDLRHNQGVLLRIEEPEFEGMADAAWAMDWDYVSHIIFLTGEV